MMPEGKSRPELFSGAPKLSLLIAPHLPHSFAITPAGARFWSRPRRMWVIACSLLCWWEWALVAFAMHHSLTHRFVFLAPPPCNRGAHYYACNGREKVASERARRRINGPNERKKVSLSQLREMQFWFPGGVCAHFVLHYSLRRRRWNACPQNAKPPVAERVTKSLLVLRVLFTWLTLHHQSNID